MIYDDSFARQIAEYLLESQAVILRPDQPFTWTSGWKSPIYCDNRLTLGHPDLRNYIFSKLKEATWKHYHTINTIAGVATAGIPAASVLAHDLHLPLVYIRGSAKKHGRENRLEGKLPEQARCLVTEDLISTGGSSIDAAEALEQQGGFVAGVVAIFTYGFTSAHEAFQNKNYPLTTLCDYSTLVEVALQQQYINKSQLKTLEAWREQPETWGKV